MSKIICTVRNRNVEKEVEKILNLKAGGGIPDGAPIQITDDGQIISEGDAYDTPDFYYKTKFEYLKNGEVWITTEERIGKGKKVTIRRKEETLSENTIKKAYNHILSKCPKPKEVASIPRNSLFHFKIPAHKIS